MRTIVSVLVSILFVLGLPTEVQIAHADQYDRVNLYYADKTTHYNWYVDYNVRLWNKNTKVHLNKVSDCESVPRCITITDPYDGYQKFGLPDNSDNIPAGLMAAYDYEGSNNVIELYRWPFSKGYLPTTDWLKRLSCHEIGHFVLQTVKHSGHGCLDESNWAKIRPGKYNRRLIPNWGITE